MDEHVETEQAVDEDEAVTDVGDLELTDTESSDVAGGGNNLKQLGIAM